MAEVKMTVRWASEGRKAQSPPNPSYPDGISLDITEGRTPYCPVPLLYPAPEVGTWFIECETCGYTAAVTAAGRPDDPREIRLPCKAMGRLVGNA